MDSTVESGQHPCETIDPGDFAALFSQLDRPEGCAAIDIGFNRMLSAIERLNPGRPGIR